MPVSPCTCRRRRGHLCCGRPLYDFGLLGAAEKYLLHVLDTMKRMGVAGKAIGQQDVVRPGGAHCG
jgi:Fe-S oxidoreductase